MNPPATIYTVPLKIMVCSITLVSCRRQMTHRRSNVLDKMRIGCTFQQWLIPFLLPNTISKNHELKHNQEAHRTTKYNLCTGELEIWNTRIKDPLTWCGDEHGLPPISPNQPRKRMEWCNWLLTNDASNEARYNPCFSSVHTADVPCYKKSNFFFTKNWPGDKTQEFISYLMMMIIIIIIIIIIKWAKEIN